MQLREKKNEKQENKFLSNLLFKLYHDKFIIMYKYSFCNRI